MAHEQMNAGQYNSEVTRLEKGKAKSKYRNKWVIIEGIKFQSEGEGHYYLHLKSRLLAGDFKKFSRQIKFEFVIGGVRVGAYIADFVVEHFNGSFEVIDYKSRFTVTLELYKIKKGLMKVCYNVVIKEVGVK